MVRYLEEDERKLLEMLAEREGTDDNVEILAERMETPTGTATTMLDAIQGLLDQQFSGWGWSVSQPGLVIEGTGEEGRAQGGWG
ncbi:hypothetical protein, partial [Roseospira visakhapatnamensis]